MLALNPLLEPDKYLIEGIELRQQQTPGNELHDAKAFANNL